MYLLAYEIGKGKTKYPLNPCYLYSNKFVRIRAIRVKERIVVPFE